MPGIESRPAPESPTHAGRWWPALLLALVAVALRTWSVAVLSRDWRIFAPALDGGYYLQLAAALSRDLSWPSGPFFMTPLYPVLLSFLFRVFPATVLTVEVAQSALGLATLALLVAAARRDLGTAAGWALGGLYVLYGPILGLESQVLTEGLLLFLASVSLWFWPRPSCRAWTCAAFGVACGLMSIGRGVYLALPAVAIAQGWWRSRGAAAGGSAGRGAAPLARTAMIAAGVGLALLPLAIHQTRTTGHLTLTTMNGGLNLFLGNNPDAVGMYSPTPGFNPQHDVTGVATASQAAGRQLDLEQASRYWTARAFDFVRRNPGRAVWLEGRKLLLGLSPLEIPQVDDFQILREHAAPLRWAFLDFRWLLPLAALGLLTAGRDRLRRLGPWLVFPALGLLSTLVFFATGRYRLATLPGYLAPAALGVLALFEMARGRRSPAAAWILPVVVVVQVLLPGYSIDHARARDAHALGMRQLGAKQPGLAVESFTRAAKWSPDWDRPWQGLANAMVDLRRLPEAQQALVRAVRINPASAESRHDLGVVRWMCGDTTGALGELAEAVRIEAYNVQYRADLAVGLEQAGRGREAARQWELVLRARPGDEAARRHLKSIREKGS
jgi:tetratricopeptide (TPR) repeat protein